METKKLNEFKKQMLSRKGITLFSQVTMIILVFCIYILADYISVGGTLKFATDVIYWITTSISLILIVTLMITVRAMHKDKLCEKSVTINENLQTINIARKVVLGNNFSDELQEYLVKVNEDNKYEAYLNKITNKINKLPLKFWLSKKKKEQLLEHYEAQLKVPKEEVLQMVVRYQKVTQTGLFAGVDGKIAVFSKHDIATHETKDISIMATKKALVAYLLTAFSGTLAVGFIWNGLDALWGTLLKLFALVLTITSALRTADDFVNYNIEQALDNRIRIILDFVNSNEAVKSKFLEKKAKEIVT